MKKPKFPLVALLLIAVLVVGLVALNRMSQNNVTVYAEHDHDHDGKPDHDDSHHD